MIKSCFLRLCAQPIDIRFGFTTGTQPDWNPDGTPNRFVDEQEGFAQVFITLCGKEHGPYQTAYRTTFRAWQYRKSVRPSPESVRIQSQVTTLCSRLVDAWYFFPQEGPQIALDMVFKRAGLKVFTVAKGGALYVL